MRTWRHYIAPCLLLVSAAASASLRAADTMAFTISMPQPATHVYHVTFRCEGLKGDTQDLKMPAWTPGYYGVLNFANNVQNFLAQDAAGQALKWDKTAANTWRVQTGQAAAFTVSYDVQATRSFVANSFLDDTRGYIMPTSTCMYVAGQIAHPVTLEIIPNPNWSTIATGLDPVSPDKPHTFAAPDFDILFDSPLLMGNLESLPPFEIQGIPHSFVGYNLGNFDRAQFMKDLKAVVEQGIAVIGDIPYKHYTFLAIGPGQGGIEHLNSTSFGFNGNGLGARAGRNRTLSFLAHEYFHHYNVKRIRPVALGPFDYDKANLTNMLWVSEGFTVYYEYLMLARAGLMTQDEILDALRNNITAYENNTGHLFQSATQSSYDTWNQGPFGRRGGGIVRTVSYYDKGPILGLLLDFKIRHETSNQKSLDTVMQTLYKEYYQDKKRGWTDDEFRAVCERVAGTPLAENFAYASTTRDPDYAKYLGYAGLALEPPKEQPQADFGAVVEEKDGKPVITALPEDSPARRAGLTVQDQIQMLDGANVTLASFNDALAAHRSGDRITLTIMHGGAGREVQVVLGHKMERSFRMRPTAHPDPLQTAILENWLAPRGR